MKVYYEKLQHADATNENIEKLRLLVRMSPADCKEYMQVLMTFIDDLAALHADMIMENYKLRTTWKLRSLEKEMEEEGGIVVLNSEGGYDLKGFSFLLTEKIGEILDSPLK